MSIPIYRQNLNYGDWEVASVYGSDDCDSLGRSADDGSSPSSSFDDPALRLRAPLHDDGRRRIEFPVPQLQQQHPSYPAVALTHPRWDTRYVPGKASSFSPPPAPIVPPPGVIFPRKDWIHTPQDTYWPPPTSQMPPVSDRPVDVGLDPVEPPPASLLFAPSSPPPISSTLIRRPSRSTMIGHGQAPLHPTTSVTLPGSNVNTYAAPTMPPPPRYHEVAMSPRLAETGRQAHSGMTRGCSPPRRSGHDVLSTSPYAPPAISSHRDHGDANTMTTVRPRRRRSSEDMPIQMQMDMATMAVQPDGRHGGVGLPSMSTVVASGGHASRHPSHHSQSPPGERRLHDLHDLHSPPPLPGKHEQEYDDLSGGRTRATTRPPTRERRPSIWQRFVRRFSPSRVSIGQT